MFDAVTPTHIPKDAKMVAGYVNGIWPTYPWLVKHFPKARVVSITINDSVLADVLDVERLDATPAQVPNWCYRMRVAGRNPIVYCSRSNIGAVEAACHANHVPPPFLWVADWTNEPHLVSGSVGTQWADGTPAYPGLAAGCDTSLVSPNWPPRFINKTGRLKVQINKPTKAQASGVSHKTIGFAGIAAALENAGNWPPTLRAVIVAAGTLVVALERYLASSKTA